MSELPLLLVICGPTAVGKSEIALELARRLGGEIISGDSAQVYRYMDIGTAKPSLRERQEIPHHLVDICDPDQRWSVADFRAAVDEIVPQVAARGHLPILAGGTMLYIRAVTAGYHFPSPACDADVRARLYARAEQEGPASLHEWLKRVDPETAARLHPRDVRRMVRALEVYLVTGIPLSVHASRRQRGPYRLLVVGLTRPRPILYRRIDARVDRMLESGLEDEVRGLLERGYGPELPSMRALGYREMVDYLYGRTTRDEARRLFARNTRHFARRQFTWMRREEDMRWIDLGENREEEGIARIVHMVGGNR
ncbi:MAG: tRNA (adenosine(37)-N6)-dimethylallyltransferase MiaA [Firmicutes bacterium]|nr:tRNA (adenosine(37)-N6)-dimethylallyltransferase MiaA [Bacillota bacterium]